MDSGSRLPLEGVSVVELGNIVAAPFASLLLADLGAEVVKVEDPESGDVVRSAGETGQAIFNAFSRNKRSLALDLKSESGREAYWDLVAAADVVVENLGPGVADRLGVGYETLREHNPGIVYLSIKGFFEGPYGDRAGMDMVAEAMSGLAAMTGKPDDQPLRVGTSIADIGAALYGVIGILVALRERDRTGDGQRVDASLFASATQWLGYWMTYADMTGTDHPSLGTSHPSFSLYDVFETATDDEYVFVGVTTDRHWPAFCRATDMGDLLADERFETAEKRRRNKDDLLDVVQAALREWDRDELVAALVDEDVPVAPVNQPSDLLTDRHLRETGLLASFGGATESKELRTAITPVRGDRITTRQRHDPPALGEHSRAVLADLGYDADTIDSLVEAGITTDDAGIVSDGVDR